jgi:hypothetical protein
MIILFTIAMEVFMKQYRHNNTDPEYVHGYTKSNGVKVKDHYRAAKQFMQNKWIDVPQHIRIHDSKFIEYNNWRIANGMRSLIHN